jgi:colicin import membrane protein
MGELMEIKRELQGIDESKAKQIQECFEPMVQMLERFEQSYNEVVSKEISPEVCFQAKRLRLDIAKVRIEADKVRKAQKEQYLRAGNAIQGVYNILRYAVEDKENQLKDIETHYERMEEQRIARLQEERSREIERYGEFPGVEFGTMADDVWENFLLGSKACDKARIDAEKKAERDRIKAEKEAEKKRKEEEARRIKEAEERARLEAERKAKEEAERKEREYQQRLEKEKREREEAKKEAERKVREEAERKKREYEQALEAERRKAEEEKRRYQQQVEAERKKQKEEQERKEAERLRIQKEREAREKDQQHKNAINDQVCASFIAAGIKAAEARQLVQIIASGSIPNIQIVYLKE